MAGRAGDRAWAGDPSLVAVGAVAGVVCGGNCSIRGATRRRHAVAVCLMVQNPPLGGGVWPGGRWPGGRPGALLPGAAGEAAPWGRGWGGVAFDARARGEGGADDGVAVVLARANGGNCSIRGATRRSDASNGAKPPVGRRGVGRWAKPRLVVGALQPGVSGASTLRIGGLRADRGPGRQQG